MDRIKFMFILVLIAEFIACKSASVIKKPNISEEWKEEWLSLFFTNYRIYKQDRLATCSDADRDIAYDIERKIRAISSYPIDQVLTETKKYLKSNNLMDFDSLTMRITSSPESEHDFSHSPAIIYLRNRKNSLKLTVGVYDKKVVYTEKNDFTDAMKMQNDGCGYGFASYTVFDRLWNWKITDIIINPDF